MSVSVLGQDGLDLGVDLLLQDDPQQVQGLSGLRHHGVVVSRHGHLVITIMNNSFQNHRTARLGGGVVSKEAHNI